MTLHFFFIKEKYKYGPSLIAATISEHQRPRGRGGGFQHYQVRRVYVRVWRLYICCYRFLLDVSHSGA